MTENNIMQKAAKIVSIMARENIGPGDISAARALAREIVAEIIADEIEQQNLEELVRLRSSAPEFHDTPPISPSAAAPANAIFDFAKYTADVTAKIESAMRRGQP